MSQEMRSVKIAFPGGTVPQEILSDKTTWGELKKQIKNDLGEDFKNQKVRDYNTNHHYSSSDAILPEGEIKLLVSTDKNKSGMPVTKANYHKASFTDLRTFCKKMTGFAPNGKQACLDALDAHYGKSSPAATTAKKATKKAAPAKKKATKKASSKSTTKVTSKVKAVKGGSLEDRVATLEARLDKYFGENDEDAGFMKAANNLR